jgi:hypothetical protein
MLFSRRIAKEWPNHDLIYLQDQLHEILLNFSFELSDPWMPFRSLEPFVWCNPEPSFPPLAHIHALEVMNNGFRVLSSYSIIHYTTALHSSPTSYSLAPAGPAILTSKDIMMAVFRCFCYCIQSLANPSPMYSGLDSPVYQFTQECPYPPPLLSNTLGALMIYVLTSHAINVFQASGTDPEQAAYVYYQTKVLILPMLKKMQRVWPVCKHYYDLLKQFLNAFPIPKERFI